MIIKVPIYVEIDSIVPEYLGPVVESLADDFYKLLRKQQLSKSIEPLYKAANLEDNRPNAKIISREKALQSLRKGVK
jgi:hypothetical protein